MKLAACLLSILLWATVSQEVDLSFKVMNSDGSTDSYVQSFPLHANLSEEVVNICRNQLIRAPGCLSLFKRGLGQKVNHMKGGMAGNDIIAHYTEFSVLYTHFAMEMDKVVPIPAERYEYDSVYNYYTRHLHGRTLLPLQQLGLCISHYQEDLSWLRTIQTPFILTTKNSAARYEGYALRIELNRGNEVSSYLRYLVDYYDALPEFTLFLHGHNQDWHQYYPVAYVIEHLQFEKGFESINNVVVYPYDDEPDARLKALWPALFEDELGPMPERGFKDKCCAQFVVRRDRIRLRSRAFYQRLYDYVIADAQDDAAKGDGYHCSMSYVLEMVWHYIFGEPAFMVYPPGSSQFELTSTSPLGQPLNLYV